VTARQIIEMLSTALTIAASAVLWHHLPANTDVFAPFDVRGGLGEQTAGRALSATAYAVTVTPQLTDRYGRKLAATGTWVVVDVALQAGSDYGLAKADLRVGPNTYRPTDRLFVMPPELQPGIADRRGWAFDVAPQVLDSVASVVFRAWVGDSRLDSRLVIDIPLRGPRAYRVDSFELADPVQQVR
jgi:hypothetical protein